MKLELVGAIIDRCFVDSKTGLQLLEDDVDVSFEFGVMGWLFGLGWLGFALIDYKLLGEVD